MWLFKITKDDNGFLAVVLQTFGFGVAIHDSDDEKSITFTFKVFKAHAMFSFALI